MNATRRYTPTAIFLHWLLAVLLVGQLAFGWMLTTVPKGTATRATVVNLHKSIGLTLLALVVVRLAWRERHPAPALPGSLGRWQRRAAGASHAALYACMIALPLVGYLASNFSRHGVLLYGLVRLPPWGPDDKALYAAFGTAHAVLAYALAILIAVHVAAALHHAFRGDGIFRRMWPALREG